MYASMYVRQLAASVANTSATPSCNICRSSCSCHELLCLRCCSCCCASFVFYNYCFFFHLVLLQLLLTLSCVVSWFCGGKNINFAQLRWALLPPPFLLPSSAQLLTNTELLWTSCVSVQLFFVVIAVVAATYLQSALAIRDWYVINIGIDF